MKDSPPLLSICSQTYNHENYIEDALKSFLSQQTDFPFEIIIHDDASTDITPEILEEYQDKHPNLIQVIYQRENQMSKGINSLVEYVFPLAKGKYIALCEGDDYWNDPQKLQKQVAFLQEHDGYSGSCHNVHLVGAVERNALMWPQQDAHDITINDLLNTNMISTPSLVFRKDALRKDQSILHKASAGDYVIALMLAESGKIRYMPDPMASYRIHEEGVWTNRRSDLDQEITHNQQLAETYRLLARSFPAHASVFKRKRLSALDALRFNFLLKEDKPSSRLTARIMLKEGLKYLSVKTFLSILVNLVIPGYLIRRVRKVHGNSVK